MDGETNDLLLLFSELDGAELSPDSAARRAVLEQILRIDPTMDRAWELLDGFDGFDAPPDELGGLMDEAEGLATRGLWLRARQVADLVGARFGERPEARAWLESLHVLWES